MTAPNELRLLPWSGPEGKPCYLSTDGPNGYMSRLADNIEAIQLGAAAELLEEVSGTLDDQGTDLNDLRNQRTGGDLVPHSVTSTGADWFGAGWHGQSHTS